MSWQGDLKFLYKQLILTDFRVRYRNMSLGVFWSLLNPLVTMAVLWFIFTKIFPSRIPHFAVFALCGIIPFNFFTLTWSTGTSSIVHHAQLIKRLGIPREVVPISTVLSSVPHLVIQLGLLICMVLLSGSRPSVNWMWMLVVWGLELVFVSGLALMFSAVNVYVQDTRYFVESSSAVLFWLVPIFYDFSSIPTRYKDLYQFNPVAAIVLAMRNILLESKAPSLVLISKLAFVAFLVLAVGHFTFRRLQRGFYEHL
jgi:ABC-type polysaccharide/polyol phosphate export permease